MSIKHIEDLTPTAFVQTLRNINEYTISEKLDGAQFAFGVDLNGEVYTSREGKLGERFYDVSDFPDTASMNGFKSAHAAIVRAQDIIKRVLDKGEAIEIEVLFGRQPNAIVYGDNRMVMLRHLLGDAKTIPATSKIELLATMLRNVRLYVVTDMIRLDPDASLKFHTISETTTWRFNEVPTLQSGVIEQVPLYTLLDEFEEWLSQPSKVESVTNEDVINVKLNCIPVANRKQHQIAREEARTVAKERFMLPIKNLLVTHVLQTQKPTFQTVDIEPHEDIGIEGVVLRHNVSGDMVKIVDKQTFTIINQFNHSVRNLIKNTVRNRETFGIKNRFEGDIHNKMLSNIAQHFRNEKLGHIMTIRQAIMKHKGDSEQDTLNNIVANIDISFDDAKQQVFSALADAIVHLRYLRLNYNDLWQMLNHTLENGVTIRHTEEIYIRTNESFANYHAFLMQLVTRISKEADTIQDILGILYEKQLKAIHQP